MKPPDRQRLKLANIIIQHATRNGGAHAGRGESLLADLTTLTSDVGAACRRLALCETRGWHHATRQQAQALDRLCYDLIASANRLQELSRTASQTPEPNLSIRDVLRDFDQLEEEFDQVAMDAKHLTLSVRTDPITLDDRYLGPFEIILKLSDLPYVRQRTVYKIVAIDPHPASTNEHVTHPHVRDEELCEGDATTAIRQALTGGRICDFFLLVRSVLTTYNAGSPFVALDDWDGMRCHDCGTIVDRDDGSYCEGCDHDLCGDCMSFCRQCDVSRCQNCLDTCNYCDDSTCTSCLSDCRTCGRSTCGNCLENNVCPACREKVEEPDESLEPATKLASDSTSRADTCPERVGTQAA